MSSKGVAQSQVIRQFSIFPNPGDTRSSKIFIPLHSIHCTDLHVRNTLERLYIPFWMLSDIRWPGQKYTCTNNGGLPGKEQEFCERDERFVYDRGHLLSRVFRIVHRANWNFVIPTTWVNLRAQLTTDNTRV